MASAEQRGAETLRGADHYKAPALATDLRQLAPWVMLLQRTDGLWGIYRDERR